MDIDILYEDSQCVVVAKPPKMLTHGHPRFPNERSLIERIQEQCQRIFYIVHRLDRSASGCVLLAKEPNLVSEYKEKLRTGTKTYLALCRGEYRGEESCWVENPVKHKGRYKEARSFVYFLSSQSTPRCSFFCVQPQTGRFHQVRRHVRDLTHPIVGDSEHGDSRINRWWRENMALERLALHAMAMDLEDLHVRCPLFPDQRDLFSRLECWDIAERRLQSVLRKEG